MSGELTTQGHFDITELDSVLQSTGAVEPPRDSFNRIKVDGPNFIAEDNAWQTPVRGDGPALICRIVAAPTQYQAKWFTDAEAERVDRPSIANAFCKSHFDIPTQARENAEDGTSCRACPFNPFERGVANKCSWKGDIRIQPFPEGDDPELTGNEPIYLLTMSTSAMFQWKGPSRDGETNFITELGRYAITNAQDLYGMTVTTREQAETVVNRALGALNAGMVAAELRSKKQVNESLGREWYIPVFTPIHIEKDENDITAATPELDEFAGTGM
jgi:hypothetical protein